jgi:phosphoribosylamine--glycine ligase
MRILVLGGGGREHAIVWALARSPRAPEIIVAPGNGGTAALAENVADLAIDDPAAVADFAAARQVDLVVIGPEVPLVAGVADALAARKIRVFGPSAHAARIEGSKAVAKGLMRRHGIPAAESHAFAKGELDRALKYVDDLGTPIVVKADGLAAGKGVTVAETREEAVAALTESFDGRFGEAGEQVLVEQFLSGPECSLLAFTDGEIVLPMAPAQDHKRAFDGDTGPNTGGMGVYSPVPAVDEDLEAEMADLLKRTVAGMRSEGIRYRGVLYGGFVLTDKGPMVLEYNARFGDPETQVLLPRLKNDLLDILFAVANSNLDGIELEWTDDVAVSVVLASGGYPGDYQTGTPITGIEDAEKVEGVTVFHAGTALRPDGTLVTAGGRVLNVTAVAPTFAAARERVYEAVRKISFDGMFYRKDIASRAVDRSPRAC